jgi:hypothetical protein
MPGSKVNLGMGQPRRKKDEGTAVKKAKGGSMMKPLDMKVGGRVDKRGPSPTVPDESGGNKKLKPAPNKGARMLPKAVRNKMGLMNKGGAVKKAKGGTMYKKNKKDG